MVKVLVQAALPAAISSRMTSVRPIHPAFLAIHSAPPQS